MISGTVEVTGMVINSMPIGEYDKRLTLLTKERGKIGVFARGARRPGNSLMGVSRLFAFGTFNLYEGRESYNLQSAQISNYFEHIAEDVEKTCYASYFMEMADYYAREYINEKQLLKLLYMSMLALDKPSIPHELTRRIYELRSMVLNGEYDVEPEKAVGDTCKYTWNYICTAPIEKLYTFGITPEAMEELSVNTDISLKKYIEKPMHSLDILKSML